MKAYIAFVVASVLAVAGCASGASVGTRNLDQAVATQGGAPRSPFRQALTDLNGDGVQDAVVLVQSGDSCTTEGCPLLVFRGSREGYNLVSRTVPVQGPVAIATTRTNGWADLIVTTPGVGKVLLVFETYGYTANAALAMAPSAGQVAQAQAVID